MVGAYFPGHMYAGMSGLAGGQYLIIYGSNHSHTSDIVTFTQKHILAVDDSSHTQLVDRLGLPFKEISDSFHSIVSDSVVIFKQQKIKPASPITKTDTLWAKSSQVTSTGYVDAPAVVAITSDNTISFTTKLEKPKAVRVHQDNIMVTSKSSKPGMSVRGSLIDDLSALSDSLTVLADDDTELSGYYTDRSVVPLGRPSYAIINAEVTSNKPRMK